METKHTKGTWEVKCLDLKSPNSIPSKPILISSQQGLVATVSRLYKIGGVSVSSGQGEANAELIAAAPETAAERDRLKAVNAELLEALVVTKEQIHIAKKFISEALGKPYFEPEKRTLDLINSAIVKAGVSSI